MRHPDWHDRLLAFIEERRSTPYAVGTNDCGMFAADAILEMTGLDPAAALRGTYSTDAEMQALLQRHGGMRRLVTGLLGAPRGPLCARRGDVVLVPTPDGDAVGVCLGTHAAFVTDAGLRMRPLSDCTASWPVE